MKFDIWVFFEKSVEKIQVSLQSEKNNGPLHDDLCTLIIMYPSVLLRMRNVLDKICRENQNTDFMFNNVFWTSCRLWDYVEKYCRDGQATNNSIILRMRIACWIPKVTQTQLVYVMLIAFSLQQWLHERTLSVLLYAVYYSPPWCIPGADKSLALPGRKQVRKHVRDARNFNNIETWAVIMFCLFVLQGKTPKEIHAILKETLACFLPGRAKDISAPLYFSISLTNGPTGLFHPSPVPHFKTFWVFLMAETKAVLFYSPTPIYFNTNDKLLHFSFLILLLMWRTVFWNIFNLQLNL